MTAEDSRVEEFVAALGEGAENSFGKLMAEVMKEGCISEKDKALIALACSAAVRYAINASGGKKKYLCSRAPAGRRSWRLRPLPDWCAWAQAITLPPFFWMRNKAGIF